jgi:Zn finger protein HypA/HybF involved in hydrogenase expression
MVGMTELAGVLSSLNAVKDITQAMINARDTAAFQSKAIELQSKILDAQSAAFSAQQERSSLIERISQLEEEVARLKAWETEKQRYELKKIGNGAFAHVLKPEHTDSEPVHALCTTCYDRRAKTILQSNGEPQWTKHAWNCPVCKTSVKAQMRALEPGSDNEG